jgi:hypothetical protein
MEMMLVPKNSINRLEKALERFSDSDYSNVLDCIGDVINAAEDVYDRAEEYEED